MWSESQRTLWACVPCLSIPCGPTSCSCPGAPALFLCLLPPPSVVAAALRERTETGIPFFHPEGTCFEKLFFFSCPGSKCPLLLVKAPVSLSDADRKDHKSPEIVMLPSLSECGRSCSQPSGEYQGQCWLPEHTGSSPVIRCHPVVTC